LTEQLLEFVNHGREELTAPVEVTEQSGPADRQAEEVVEQILGLAQRDAEMSATVAGEQAGARADVGAGQFQVATALAGPLTTAAAKDMPPVAMPFQLRFGDVGHDVVLELAGGFEVMGAAMRALLGPDVVFEEDGAGRGFGSEESGVLTVFPTATVGAGSLGIVVARTGAFAALADGLQLMLDQSESAAEVGVLRLQVGDPLFQGTDEGQDGGLSLRWDRVPEMCGDRWMRNHTPCYEASVQKVRSREGSGRRKTPGTKRGTA
jgi:hypothetical protein